MPEFFNPYNFIPTPPRTGDFPDELKDRLPVGHHRLHPDHWSGNITVDMQAVSPLLVPSGDFSENNDHKTKRTRTVAGKVNIPPSSVKGMIRSAFEAITNSRFGEFVHHGRPLAFRQEARDGIAAFPAIIENGQIRVLLGETQMPRTAGHSNFAEQQVIAAAWVFTDVLKKNSISHNDLVQVEIEKKTHDRGFTYQRVTKIAKLNDESVAYGHWGVVYSTGVTILNSGKKHYERIFLLDGQNDPTFPLTPEIKDQWKHLIADAREKHEDEESQFADYVKKQEDDSYSWKNLDEGSLLYVRLRAGSGAGDWVIDVVQPVGIARQLHPNSPLEMLDSSLRPAGGAEEFSPGERVFGWVHGDGGDARHTAYAGSVRFGEVICTSGDALEPFGKALPILAQPKPEQARFYLGVKDRTTIKPFDNGTPKQGVRYDASQSRALRGRKVYPNQNRQPVHAGVDKSNLNQSYLDRIRAGSKFRFTLFVRNLSSAELGALLTVLDLSQIIDDGNQRCLSFGGAKPLGYGSVKISIDWNNTHLQRGSQAVESLRDFRAPTSENDQAKATAANFLALVRGRSFFESFKVATKGYKSTDEVHYPSVSPGTGRVGEDTLRWFTQNERVGGNKLSLPALTADGNGKLRSYPPN